MTNLFWIVFYIALVVTGGYWIYSRHVDVSFEGFEPFYAIEGKFAVILGGTLVVVGVGLLILYLSF